jgi:dTDP-4-amino-4,6-dideoxygalactose transaminase
MGFQGGSSMKKRIVPIVDLGAEYLSIKAEVDRAFARVMQSGHYVLGPEGKLLEAEIARFSKVKEAVGVNSGTDALILILKSLNVGPGDEVITTPYTFFATIEAILHAGAKPVLTDIDPVTFNLDPSQLSKRLTRRTKAIIAVHLYGQMADMSAIGAIARKAKVEVVEDMAQALGATQNGKPAGSFGRAAGLSFYPTKNLGGAGDSGMILTNDSALAEEARCLRSHGTKIKYQYDKVGFNSRLDELQAALLNIKLKRLSLWTKKRIALAKTYDRLLEDTPVTRPAILPGNRHVYHLYTIRSPQRDALQVFLKSKGIESGVHYPVPLHLAPALSPLNHREGDFPESERAAREVLSLPLHSQMSGRQAEIISRAIHQFFH